MLLKSPTLKTTSACLPLVRLPLHVSLSHCALLQAQFQLAFCRSLKSLTLAAVWITGLSPLSVCLNKSPSLYLRSRWMQIASNYIVSKLLDAHCGFISRNPFCFTPVASYYSRNSKYNVKRRIKWNCCTVAVVLFKSSLLQLKCEYWMKE